MLKRATPVSLVAYLGLCTAFAQGNSDGHASDKAVHETVPHNQAGGGASSTAISYHGGPVLVNGVNAYYIWYGNWSGNTAPTILKVLAQYIGGSPYFRIDTTSTDASEVHALNLVRPAREDKRQLLTGYGAIGRRHTGCCESSDQQRRTRSRRPRRSLLRVDLGRCKWNIRLLYAVLWLAHAWHHRRHRYQYALLAIATVSECLFRPEHFAEWQPRRRRDGLDHRARVGRGHDRP